jgi:hypothetical protein
LRAVRTFSQSFQLEYFPLDMQMLMARIALNQGCSFFRFAKREENEFVWACGEDGAAINAVNGAVSASRAPPPLPPHPPPPPPPPPLPPLLYPLTQAADQFSPMMGEWRLKNKTISVSCLSAKEASRTQTQYPVLKLLILTKRRWGYHFFLFGVPLLLILFLACLLAQKMDKVSLNFGERAAALFTLLFAAIQLKAQVAALLPRLHTTSAFPARALGPWRARLLPSRPCAQRCWTSSSFS